MDNNSGPKPRKHLFGYLDETGLLHSPVTDQLFALGLLSIQSPRNIHKQIINYKTSKQYHEEFKFSALTHENLPLYKGLIDIFFQNSNQKFYVAIYDKKKLEINNHNKAYNSYCGVLISETLADGDQKSSEYITVLADDVSTPKDDKFESEIRDKIKSKLRRNALFGICRLESHAVTEIQLCDVLLGATAYAYKLKLGLVGKGKSEKKELIRHIQRHLSVPLLAGGVDRTMRKNTRYRVIEHL